MCPHTTLEYALLEIRLHRLCNKHLYCVDQEWLYFIGGLVFNWLKKEHGPSSANRKRKGKRKKVEEGGEHWPL